MDTIKIWNDDPSDRQLDEIAASLTDGQIIVMPTDSIYCLACDALDARATERLCRAKGIKSDKAPLSIICSDISMAAEYGRIDNGTYRMMRDNTPGPFTFLIKALSALPRAFKQRKVVGIRIPGVETPRKVAERLGHPVLCTSIPFEHPDYARDPGLIAEAMEQHAALMVEGDEGGDIPSTIVDCTGGEIEVTRQGLGELR